MQKVIVQVDSQAVVRSLQRDEKRCVSAWSLIKVVRKLISSSGQIQIFHVFREANACGDALANLASMQVKGGVCRGDKQMDRINPNPYANGLDQNTLLIYFN